MGSIADKARELRGIASRIGDMSPMIRVIGQDVLTFVDDHFASATDALGNRFRGFSAATLSINPRRAGGTPLSDTARLRRSFTVRAEAAALVFGTNAVQARAQFFGNPNNRVFGKAPGPIPARNPMPIDASGRLQPDSFWNDARERLSRWLATGQVT